MSDLLTLARDYIERMANPVYGYSTNEDYSMRFAKLLESEGFDAQLRGEIEGLRDRDALTSYGWLWLIGWAKSRRIDLAEGLLVELFQEWWSVYARCAVIDLATQRAGDQFPFSRDNPLGEFPNPFLAKIMLLATEPREAESSAAELGRPTGLAESVLVALLQVGRPITLEAASVLLRHHWKGQHQLLEFFWALCNSLDPETREAWIERLNPPAIG
jgi:hypothetical protein